MFTNYYEVNDVTKALKEVRFPGVLRDHAERPGIFLLISAADRSSTVFGAVVYYQYFQLRKDPLIYKGVQCLA